MPPDRLHPFDLPIQRILVDLETRLPPWMNLVPQSHNDTSMSRLTAEIVAFADLVSPTSKERRVRQDIIDRLQLQVRKVWTNASVVPIGSYAQELYTSASDMDLFVLLPDVPYSLEHLESLYNALHSSSLAATGTLTLVRGARVPIIKYIDSRGSGIQVDVSMNNVSATSSADFVQLHLSQTPLLRPLTMVLKQWLFQRKMNEVYLRGGLSSYALFLLILTTVHHNKPDESVPTNERLGRFLVKFLRQWSSPTAFADVIRPLFGFLDKSALNWEDPYQPFSLCIQDPVNEDNCIGRQTFSIREIQKEWALSLNALTVAIEEFEMNVHRGRQKSLLASIVGLTTRFAPPRNQVRRSKIDGREYESRKQINNVLPDPTTTVRQPQTPPAVAKHPQGGRHARTAVVPATTKPANYVSPPPDLNPKPAKRYKFRNVLTRDGRLVGHEEVGKIVDESGRRRAELKDFESSVRDGRGSAGNPDERRSKSRNSKMESKDASQASSFVASIGKQGPNRPALIDFSIQSTFEESASISDHVEGQISVKETTMWEKYFTEMDELVNLSYTPATDKVDDVPSTTHFIPHDSRFQELVDLWPTPSASPQSPAETTTSLFSLWNDTSPVCAPTPNDSPEVSTVPSSPSIQSAPTTPIMSTAVRNTAASPLSAPPLVAAKLLDLDGNTGSVETESGTMGDLAGLSTPFIPTSLSDLAGLDFNKFPTVPCNTLILGHLLAEPIVPAAAAMSSIQTKQVATNAAAEDTDRPVEAIIFQGRRHARRSTAAQIKLVDPESADRAFRMFSQAIKSPHRVVK